MSARAKIRHKGRRWFLSLVDGQGIEHAKGGFATQREAKARARELLGSPIGGGRGGKRILRDYAAEWLAARQNADLSPSTRDTDRTVLEAWILPHIGTQRLEEIEEDPTVLDGLYRTLRERGGRGGRPLRGKSVRNVHVTLSKALGDAVKRGYIRTNPVLAVDPPARDDSIERGVWNRQQAVAFLRVAEQDRLGAVWRLALATGLRRGELLGLGWEDIDLEAGTGRVARQVLVRPRAVQGQPRVYVRGTTKSRRVRVVRVDAATAAALRAWKAAQGRERMAFGPAWKAHGGLGEVRSWVVTEPDGAVLHPDTLFGRFARVAKAAGVPAIGLHGARHTYATMALESRIRLDIVSHQLGHSSAATTANIYAHVLEEAATEAAEHMGMLLADSG